MKATPGRVNDPADLRRGESAPLAQDPERQPGGAQLEDAQVPGRVAAPFRYPNGRCPRTRIQFVGTPRTGISLTPSGPPYDSPEFIDDRVRRFVRRAPAAASGCPPRWSGNASRPREDLALTPVQDHDELVLARSLNVLGKSGPATPPSCAHGLLRLLAGRFDVAIQAAETSERNADSHRFQVHLTCAVLLNRPPCWSRPM